MKQALGLNLRRRDFPPACFVLGIFNIFGYANYSRYDVIFYDFLKKIQYLGLSCIEIIKPCVMSTIGIRYKVNVAVHCNIALQHCNMLIVNLA